MPDGTPAESVAPSESPDPLLDDWDKPPRVPSIPELHVDGFDGPLDLLLDLAARARIDLSRLSIAAVVDQLAAALARSERHVPIERRAEWLVLASRLLVLRSRLLLATDPASAEAAEQDAAREVRRLRDLQFVRAAAAWLDARPQLGREVFARPARGRDPRVASYMRLMEACLAVLERGEEQAAQSPALDAEALYRPVMPVLFRVPRAIERMRARLAEADSPALLPSFMPAVPADAPDRDLLARSAVSSTLIAALELARSGEAVLSGSDLFQEAFVSVVATGAEAG